MKAALLDLAYHPWTLWGSFAAGFLFPPLFLLFLTLGSYRAFESFRKEYGEVPPYWYDKGREALEKIDVPSAPLPGTTPLPLGRLEMV